LRLRKHIYGISDEVLDPAVVGCDDKCALWQWIYSVVDKHDSMPLFH